MTRLRFNICFILFWAMFGVFLFWFFAQAAEWMATHGLWTPVMGVAQ